MIAGWGRHSTRHADIQAAGRCVDRQAAGRCVDRHSTRQTDRVYQIKHSWRIMWFKNVILKLYSALMNHTQDMMCYTWGLFCPHWSCTVCLSVLFCSFKKKKNCHNFLCVIVCLHSDDLPQLCLSLFAASGSFYNITMDVIMTRHFLPAQDVGVQRGQLIYAQCTVYVNNREVI